MDNSITIISDTIQEFMGERFYLCGNYFQHNGKRLHRTVWEHFNGSIPEGYHIHHMDGDRRNNRIENLALLPGTEHQLMHARTEARRENGRRAILFAIEVAPEWHHSEEGKLWHREHARKTWDNKEPHTETCAFCGKQFETRDFHKRKKWFCGQNCRLKYKRRHPDESLKS